MTLEILSPDASLFTGEVDAVQLPGIDGLFEILNNHAPMIAVLGSGNIRIRSKEGDQNFNIKSGIVECLSNKVAVLVEGVTE